MCGKKKRALKPNQMLNVCVCCLIWTLFGFIIILFFVFFVFCLQSILAEFFFSLMNSWGLRLQIDKNEGKGKFTQWNG